jgi:hypothetical protein
MLKTCPGWKVLNVTTEPTPSTTWTRLLADRRLRGGLSVRELRAHGRLHAPLQRQGDGQHQ